MSPITISVVGSAGSIGTQVMDVARRLGPERVRIAGLATHANVDTLVSQALEFHPEAVCIGDESKYQAVAHALEPLGIRVCSGAEGYDEIAALAAVQRVVVSLAGTPGLSPTLTAISHGKDVALASKEVLVAAGHLVTAAAREHKVKILPIDSEHSAIFQCLNGESKNEIELIYLTASGGAFRNRAKADLEKVTPEEALAHPTWKMGKKVTVDSATLMNKGLEVIEAKWLFGVEADRVQVVIHQQSIIHSMVAFEDGSVIAQLGLPDMRLPIQYALLYPERVNTGLPRLNPIKAASLTFEEVDLERFECLELAMMAAKIGGTLAVAMNAADEVAVEMFLTGRIGFMDIPRIVRNVMNEHESSSCPGLEEIKYVDAESRQIARESVGA